ncbi:unnamed protein product [Meloidogyne enterolobii]|uniref:Uncharacterized protein n=1 Tax=Meloidogyne enterolobii TaxID=390850 RepID=A0ACB1B851_MELEN
MLYFNNKLNKAAYTAIHLNHLLHAKLVFLVLDQNFGHLAMQRRLKQICVIYQQ